MSKVLIFVDSREAASGIYEYFGQYDCEIQQKMLVVGDYLVSDRICIERKFVDDFAQSIIDKRIFKQLARMKEDFEKPVLIIEGDTLYGRLHPNMIRGALAAITIDLEIPIIWSKNAAETAGMIYWLARREQLLEKREIPLRNKKKAPSIKEQQEFLISGLPDISTVRAKALLKYFKSPEKIFSADEKELTKVDGIGKGIAKKIKDVLSKKYSK
ncbi:MAG: ERCC4 domain-containing protein [Candidatus Aenigmatarchaeota archaeon]